MDLGIPPPPPTPPPSRNLARRLYAWILTWAHHPMGTWALAFFAFVDSSVFPIPPLFLQVALSLERPKRSWWYATVDLVGSLLGAIVGFLIGWLLYDTLGKWVIETWGLEEQFARFGTFIKENGFWFTFLYAFLPFPYKVITIGTGFFGGSLGVLLVASGIGRALRFYMLAAVCYWKGARAKDIIDRHFNKVLFGIALLVIAVILIMKFTFSGDQEQPASEKKTGASVTRSSSGR
jgi:membrane protein YqaA with SNARE-associated domain